MFSRNLAITRFGKRKIITGRIKCIVFLQWFLLIHESIHNVAALEGDRRKSMECFWVHRFEITEWKIRRKLYQLVSYLGQNQLPNLLSGKGSEDDLFLHRLFYNVHDLTLNRQYELIILIWTWYNNIFLFIESIAPGGGDVWAVSFISRSQLQHVCVQGCVEFVIWGLFQAI